jgi:hypothetical protein
LAADTIAGTATGLAATWLAVVVRKLATGQVPGPLMISAAMLCPQAALVFAAGQAWIYLLRFPLAKFVLSVLFARSAPTGQPLIARLAAEMTSLRQNCQENSGPHRYFKGVTWLWASISGPLAVIFAVLVATVPIASFLLISCLAVIGTGAAVFALWFFAVLRHLRLRLAPG